jgi:ferredoxin-NADP reductase
VKKAETFAVRLISSRLVAPAVREIVFERVDGGVVDFDPGQWVNLVLPLPTGEVRRAYSIASEPDGSSRFEIAVTRVENGPGSTYLHELPEGAVISAIGPHGLFTRNADDPAPALFVGTGTGVTPLRSMLRAALRHSSQRAIRRDLVASRTNLDGVDGLRAESRAGIASRIGKPKWCICARIRVRPRADGENRAGIVPR